MRKLFLSMAAVAALLTSCSKDETTTAPVIERSKVTFTVNAPELSTRAEADYGTGLTAKTLDYVIYDLAEEAGKNQITGTTTFPDGELETEVTVDLVEGREYEAIFFAHAEGAPYTFNKTEQTMTINTTSLKANAESYDAFYKYVEPFVMPATGLTKTVEMTRPFAQLNVATNDYQNEEIPAGMMIDAATTGIEVEAYNTLNFKDGTVSGKETIIYALADKMDGTITANNVDYSWLTMNYILVNTQETVGVKFLFTDTDKDNNVQTYERKYSAVPVERNHKTNIIGSILTSTTEFKVEILPGFEDTHIYDVDNTEEVVVTTAAELQAAIDAAVPGTNIIKFGNNITVTAAGVTISQTEGINIVIDGAGKTYNGTFYVNGNSRHTGTETLTFTDITFKHSNGAIDFISSNNGGDSVIRYAHNVTVENCTFLYNGPITDANGNSTGAVGLRFRQSYNIKAVNCTIPAMYDKDNANKMFLLLWATGGENITIDGADVTVGANGEGGVSFGTSTDIVVKNSTITNNNQTGYGVRVADNSTANNINITLENNTIEANYPVVARYMNIKNNKNNDDTTLKDNVNMTFNGVNTLTATNANGYQVVFTHDNDNAPLAEPKDATITLTGADSYNVFPRDLVIATAEELKAFRDAVNDGTSYKDKVVKLAADIDLNNTEWTPIGGSDLYKNNFAGTFDGMGYTIKNLTVNNTSHAGLFGTMVSGVIKNLTVDGATLTTNHYAGGIVAQDEAGGGSLTIENCHVKNATITVNVADNDNGDKAGGIIGWSYYNTIIGCSVENTTITAYRDCGGIVGYVNGGTVKNNTVTNVTLKHYLCPTYKVDKEEDRITSETHPSLNFGDIIGRRATTDILEGGNSGTVTKEGGIFDGIYEVEGEWNIITLKGLKQFATNVNSGNNYKNKTVKLVADIDLKGEEWTPIGKVVENKKYGFQGTFDGDNHMVSNLKINNTTLDHAGLFGYTEGATIKNVKVNNVSITAKTYVGPIAGTVYTGSVENCHVSGEINLYADYAYAGGITSQGYVTVRNCTVIAKGTGTITVKEKTMAGGITGWRGEGNNGIYNCTVKNLEISAYQCVGAISGLVHYDNTITNCTAENVKLTKTRQDGQASIGLAAGCWAKKANENPYTITITNNTFNNISLNGSAAKVNSEGEDISSFLQDGQRLIGSNYSYYINIPDNNLVANKNSYNEIFDNLTFIE